MTQTKTKLISARIPQDLIDWYRKNQINYSKAARIAITRALDDMAMDAYPISLKRYVTAQNRAFRHHYSLCKAIHVRIEEDLHRRIIANNCVPSRLVYITLAQLRNASAAGELDAATYQIISQCHKHSYHSTSSEQ